MTRERQLLVWSVGFIAVGLLLHALFGMLLPFVMGMAIAYFLDPVADKLESLGLSRALATTVILLSFFVVLIGALVVLVPLLGHQISVLLGLVPDLIEGAREIAEPYLERLKADIPDDTLSSIRENMAGIAQNIAKSLTGILSHVWSGGLAFFNALSLIIVTPIVAFYLLRDWDLITAKVDSWLPRREVEVIREQCREIDKTLAAFVRGQATVCLVLALYYGACLSFVGLESGLLVGLGAGLISFVPYIGAAIGLGVGLAIALFQFSDLAPIALVVIVFLLGQTVESYFLTPRLVGDSVGLHPVWIMFALLAGGALFGFTGVLLAVPAAAVIGVLVRFGIGHYLDSPLYSGGPHGLPKEQLVEPSTELPELSVEQAVDHLEQGPQK